MQSFEDSPFIIEKKSRRRAKARRVRVHTGGRAVKAVVAIMLLCGLVAVGAVLFFGNAAKTFTVKGRAFYAVRMYAGENAGEADEFAVAVVSAGGGGYVYNDGTFSVLAAVYPSRTDAETVAKRNDGEVIALTVDKVKLSLYDDRATSQTLSDSMRYAFTTLYDELHKIATALDGGTLSEAAATYRLAAVKNAYLDSQNALESLNVKYPADATIGKLRLSSVTIASALETDASKPIASQIRYAACAAVCVSLQTLQNL